MLSLVHVLQWRAAVSPEAVALTDHQGARLTYAGLSSRAEPPDLSQLTEVVYGASPIRPDLLERAVAVTLREPFWAGRDRLVS